MVWHYSMLSLKQAFIVNDNCGIIWIGVIIMEDKFDLERFVKEQERSFDIAYKEVSNGMKRSHWMWYIFPQIIGLGMTYISQKFSIKSIDEAICLNNPKESLINKVHKDPRMRLFEYQISYTER